MNHLLAVLVLALSLTGCGKSYCADLAAQICNHCDVGETTRDKMCACLEDGEVRNGSKYFDTRKEAEVYCYAIQAGVKDEYVGPDRVAECRGDLEVFEQFDSDACELHGYDAPSGGYDSYDSSPSASSGACASFLNAICDCYGYGSEECAIFEEYVEEGIYSSSECEAYLDAGVC